MGSSWGELVARFLPAGVARDFFTTSVAGRFGPLTIDLVAIGLTLGPLSIHLNVMPLGTRIEAMSAENAPISASSIVVAEPKQVSVNVGEETLILHVETGGYYSLRNVAARIWQLLDKPVPVSDVGEILSQQYGIPRDRCEADLLELLSQLVERGLVRVVPSDQSIAMQ